MKCQNCGAEIQNSKAKFCPKCGAPNVEPVAQVQAEKPVFPHDISAVWPEWQIEKQLGKGSYGVVYQAVRRDNNVESKAAIKIISIPTDASEVDSLRSEGLDMDGTRSYFKGIVDDFVSEIQLMESLKGMQNIVSVEDYKVVEKSGEIGWNIYIRMELLVPFNNYICDKNLTEAEVIKLGTDICSALEICNQRNIIHRDIKPENIFVNDFGYFKLGDFGIARKLENMTGGLSQKGTYNYMAPEVANSNDYDARVDTYSLGLVLYRLLNNNKLPFLDTEKQLLSPSERKSAVERRIRGEALPAPLGASAEMADLILRACAYNPDFRFASATEMKKALEDVQSGTYKIAENNLDKTTSVRHAESDLNATAAVRKAPADTKSVGAPVVENFDNKPKAKKGKKALIIAIAIVVVIIGIAVAGVVCFFTSPGYNVYKDMNDNNISDALTLYRSDVKDKFIQQTIVDKLLEGRVDEVVADYESGEIQYATAIEALNALDEMGFDGAKEKGDEITVSEDAENALEMADEYYEDGDLENAINEYAKIPESNENYEEAQEKLNQVYADYIANTVSSAKSFNSTGKYKEAINHINTAYDVLPDDIDTTELDTLKEESFTSYKSDIGTQVGELVDDGDYAEAFTVIDNAIAYEDDEYFQELKTTTETKYVGTIEESVNKYLEKEDYITAARVVDNALTVLPDNDELKELKKDVEKATPIYLLDVLEPYETYGFSKYVNGETIAMGGKTYTNAFTLGGISSWSPNEYAIFNLDSQYTTLSFSVGHVDDTNMTKATIKIYCDGVLKSEFTVNGDELPQKKVLDITGVDQLKIVADVHQDADYGFANITVK